MIVKAKCSHLPEPSVPEATGEQPSHASHAGAGGACSEPVPPTWSLLAGWEKKKKKKGRLPWQPVEQLPASSHCASRLGRCQGRSPPPT